MTCRERAVLVLLGGLKSANELSANSRARVELALETVPPPRWMILSTGFTRYKPPFLDKDGFPALESRVAAECMVRRGVDRATILTEDYSFDTIGNFYFSMTRFIQPLGIKHVQIVTSDFHSGRADAVARWIFGLSGWAVHPEFTMLCAPDSAKSTEARSIIVQKEYAGLMTVEQLSKELNTVRDVCLWLHTRHGDYDFQATRLANPAPEIY